MVGGRRWAVGDGVRRAGALAKRVSSGSTLLTPQPDGGTTEEFASAPAEAAPAEKHGPVGATLIMPSPANDRPSRPRRNVRRNRDSEAPRKPRRSAPARPRAPRNATGVRTNRRIRPREEETSTYDRETPESLSVTASDFGDESLGLEVQPKLPIRLWQKVRGPVVLIGKVLGAAIVIAACVAVGRLVHEFALTSEAFALQEIVVEGQERLDEVGVLAAAQVAVGDNAFAHSPEELEQLLVAHPWVAEATVERRLPSHLSLTIREHHAVALLSLDEGLFLVGDDATLFKSLGEGDPVDLPVITGVARDDFVGDRAFRTSLLLQIVALMHDYRAAGLWRREPIGEINAGPGGSLTLFVGEDAMEVRLGVGPFRQKLRRLRRVLDRLQERESRAVHVFLDNVRRPDRVTVRLREAPMPPPAPEAVQAADS